jgi:hypothetical protein
LLRNITEYYEIATQGSIIFGVSVIPSPQCSNYIQAIERPRGSRAPNSILGRRRGGISNGPHKRARFIDLRKGNPCVQEGGPTTIGVAGLTLARQLKPLCPPKTSSPMNLSAVRPRHSRSRLLIGAPTDANLKGDERRAPPFLLAEVSGRCAEPAATPSRTSGGAR